MIKVGNVNQKSSPVGANRYATEDYSRELLVLLRRWRDGDHRPLVIPADSTGMLPKTLRVSIYQARTFIRENPELFKQEDVDLVNSASFEISAKPAGLLIRRRSAAFSLDKVAMEISRDTQDHEAYQAFMNWISEPRALDDKYIINGPFNSADYDRFKDALSKLKGIYLASITPQVIQVIYHPGGK